MTADLVVVPRSDIDPARWDTAVESSAAAWLWHRHAFGDVLSTWRGHQDRSAAIVDGDAIVAVLPLQLVGDRVARRLPYRTLLSWGGPAIVDTTDRAARRIRERAVEHLLAEAAGTRAHQLDVVLPTLAPLYRPGAVDGSTELARLGCALRSTTTWMLDLTVGREAIWNGLEGRVRTAIRKAESEGARARRSDEPGDLDVYYALHEATYARTGVRSHPRAYFEGIWEHFVATGRAQVWFGEANGEVLAAQVFAVDRGASLYWTGASDERALSIGLNNLVQWEAISSLSEQVEWHEIGEAFPGSRSGKARGLNDFKRGFGGRLHSLPRGRLPLPTGRLPLRAALRHVAELRRSVATLGELTQ